MMPSTRRKVGYFYDSDVGNFYYAQGHPMKPHRMRMTHNLLVAYGLFDKMDVLITPRATDREMTRFHSDEYINFLKVVTPEAVAEQSPSLCRFNVLEDCPVFDGLWEYCQIAAGGSLAGAARLNSGDSSIAVNWAGGLHHAKKAEASGFCYINDCVLAILELLKVHARVLYVDIDIHHGDGVEEAFYTTDRVMTASFHKFGDYFPGTGDANDIGLGRGKHYSANFPLRDGIDDESYREIFVPVMSRIMEWYQPGAVVLQCGADSLTGDRLGCFNLSLFGHAQCVDFFKRYDVPILLLGGGGYTVRNVARCWAYETSRVVGETLSDELPYNENYEFYGPDFRLHINPSNMENHNSEAELQRTKARIFENLRHLPHAPSAPFMDIPRVSPLGLHKRDEDSDDDDPDVRYKSRRGKAIVDYAGSDDEDDDQYISSLRHSKRRQKKLNFPRRCFPTTLLGPPTVQKRTMIPTSERDQYSPRKRPESDPEKVQALQLSAAIGTGLGTQMNEDDVEEMRLTRGPSSGVGGKRQQHCDGGVTPQGELTTGYTNVGIVRGDSHRTDTNLHRSVKLQRTGTLRSDLPRVSTDSHGETENLTENNSVPGQTVPMDVDTASVGKGEDCETLPNTKSPDQNVRTGNDGNVLGLVGSQQYRRLSDGAESGAGVERETRAVHINAFPHEMRQDNSEVQTDELPAGDAGRPGDGAANGATVRVESRESGQSIEPPRTGALGDMSSANAAHPVELSPNGNSSRSKEKYGNPKTDMSAPASNMLPTYASLQAEASKKPRRYNLSGMQNEKSVSGGGGTSQAPLRPGFLAMNSHGGGRDQRLVTVPVRDNVTAPVGDIEKPEAPGERSVAKAARGGMRVRSVDGEQDSTRLAFDAAQSGGQVQSDSATDAERRQDLAVEDNPHAGADGRGATSDGELHSGVGIAEDQARGMPKSARGSGSGKDTGVSREGDGNIGVRGGESGAHRRQHLGRGGSGVDHSSAGSGQHSPPASGQGSGVREE